MNSPDRLRRAFGPLLAHEIRNVGLALLREGMLAAAALILFCLLLALTANRYGERVDMIPEMMLTTLPLALLFPWAVWKDDPPFGQPLLWSLPVRRQQAALAKILAGAFWLLAAILFTFVSVSLMSLATGGRFGLEEVRLVGLPSQGLERAARVNWTTPFWMWLTPFGAALIIYLASSAAWIGLRHPVRWIAGAAVTAALVIGLIVNVGEHSALEHMLNRCLGALIDGRYGLDLALTGGIDLAREIDVPGPGSKTLWVALPEAGRWTSALALWTGGALIALALALRRHWER